MELPLLARLATGEFQPKWATPPQAILDGEQRDNPISSFRVKEACTESSLDSWTVWQRDRKRLGFTAIRTRWTSSRCLVCGATTVDCNGGRRGRTTFKYVTGKVTITKRVLATPDCTSVAITLDAKSLVTLEKGLQSLNNIANSILNKARNHKDYAEFQRICRPFLGHGDLKQEENMHRLCNVFDINSIKQ